jgi:hypothetical protein
MSIKYVKEKLKTSGIKAKVHLKNGQIAIDCKLQSDVIKVQSLFSGLHLSVTYGFYN